MLIKKYVADTESNAIMMAREELGSEAVVMNIKKTEPKGIMKLFKKGTVEITAAVDESFEKQKTETKKTETKNTSLTPNSKTLEALEKAMLNGELDVKTKERQAPEVKKANPKAMPVNELETFFEDRIKEETIKESEADNKKEKMSERMSACKKLIRTQLKEAEVAEKYVDELLADVDDMFVAENTINAILACLYQKIILKLGQPKLIYSEKEHPKFYFFIGATGVGKTTTIAKIVSDLRLNKKAKVALVTADTYRIAAVEQLKTYAGILDVPVKVVYSAEEMEEAVEELDEFEYVLVDTAGRSHLNEEQKNELIELLDSVEDKDIYLTLSVTTKYKDLLDIAKMYKDITDYSIIFTKLDETKCIGNIYNIRQETGASLSYITTGQNVPDDIEKLDTQYIAKKLLGGNDDGSGRES